MRALLAALIIAGNLGAVDIVPDIVYGHKMGMALTMDLLRPPDAKANGAAC